MVGLARGAVVGQQPVEPGCQSLDRVRVIGGGDEAEPVGAGKPGGLTDEPGMPVAGQIVAPPGDHGGDVGVGRLAEPPAARVADDLAELLAVLGQLGHVALVQHVEHTGETDRPTAAVRVLGGERHRDRVGLAVDGAGHPQHAVQLTDVVHRAAAILGDSASQSVNAAVESTGRSAFLRGVQNPLGTVVGRPIDMPAVAGRHHRDRTLA